MIILHCNFDWFSLNKALTVNMTTFLFREDSFRLLINVVTKCGECLVNKLDHTSCYQMVNFSAKWCVTPSLGKVFLLATAPLLRQGLSNTTHTYCYSYYVWVNAFTIPALYLNISVFLRNEIHLSFAFCMQAVLNQACKKIVKIIIYVKLFAYKYDTLVW